MQNKVARLIIALLGVSIVISFLIWYSMQLVVFGESGRPVRFPREIDDSLYIDGGYEDEVASFFADGPKVAEAFVKINGTVTEDCVRITIADVEERVFYSKEFRSGEQISVYEICEKPVKAVLVRCQVTKETKCDLNVSIGLKCRRIDR